MRNPIRVAIACVALAAPVAARAQKQSSLQSLRATPTSDLHPGWLNDAAESPNGRFVLVRGIYPSDSGLQRYDRKTKSWARLVGTPANANALRWAPNGRFVSYNYTAEGLRGQYIWVLPMDTTTGLASGAPRRVTTRPGGHAAWAPDGRRIAYPAGDSIGYSVHQERPGVDSEGFKLATSSGRRTAARSI
jgi:Tol biopolymer transport system component